MDTYISKVKKGSTKPKPEPKKRKLKQNLKKKSLTTIKKIKI